MSLSAAGCASDIIMVEDEYGKLPDEFYQFQGQTIGDEPAKHSKLFLRKSAAAVKLFSCAVSVMLLTAAASGAPVLSDFNPFETQGTTQLTAAIDVSHENGPRIPELGHSAPEGSERHQGTVSDSEKTEPAPAVAERECPVCLGTGIICPGDPNFGFDRGNGNGYAGCGGTGYSPCPDIWCNNGIKTCQNCRGSGIDQHGEPDQVCGGRGIVDCEFCNNTGIAPCICASSHVICDQCNGTGKVSEDSA